MARKTLTEKQYSDLKSVYHTFKNNTASDTDDYMRGFFNGMELMMSIIEKREPVYKQSPIERKLDSWLKKHL